MKVALSDYLTNRVPLAGAQDSAGSIMDDLKLNDYETIQNIFIVDEANRLKGQISLNSLLRSSPDKKAAELMKPCKSIRIDQSPGHAANHALFKEVHSIPVINENGIFRGILSPRTIIEILRDEHITDLHRIAGVGKEDDRVKTASDEAPARRVKHRLPWLLVGLAGSLLATMIMANYEQVLNQNIKLTFFIPGIVYLADAIGTQTETIVIRGMSLSQTTFSKILQREIITGSLIGLILGSACLPMLLVIGYELDISMVVSATIILASLVATSIGLILPWLLQRLGKDPAFGSGPLATIIQDILSISIYFMIARLIFSWLI